MVVSDDPPTLERVTERLQAAGCHVLAAETGDAALSLLSAEAMPDALIGDFFNPETDGQQFLDTARLRYGRKALPPMMFLLDSPEDEVVAKKYDVFDIVTKPVSSAALFSSLNCLLASSGVTVQEPPEAVTDETVVPKTTNRLSVLNRLPVLRAVQS